MLPKNRKAGFTLIELVMTIIVVAIVVIPSSLFLVESVKGTFKSEDITIALNLARFELERINNLPYSHSDMRPGTTTLGNYQGYNYDLVRTVTRIISGGGRSVREIKIEAYPSGEAGNPQYLLTTVITHRTNYVIQ